MSPSLLSAQKYSARTINSVPSGIRYPVEIARSHPDQIPKMAKMPSWPTRFWVRYRARCVNNLTKIRYDGGGRSGGGGVVVLGFPLFAVVAVAVYFLEFFFVGFRSHRERVFIFSLA